MSANPNCRIQITHSCRPLHILEIPWSRLIVKFFGMDDPHNIISIYEALKKDGRAEHSDESGTFFMVALDDIEVIDGS